MTFTEAAVEVLRLVGKPLHYKKITEIAIERNLLSHVGKTPEITMSSRLATMVKKDRGDAPIVKVKPGIFGLRDFPEDVLGADEAEGEEAEVGDLPEVAPAEDVEKEEAPEKRTSRTEHKPPGAEVFPEEDDDDEPILAKLDEETDRDDEAGKRRKRRRRGRRRDEGEGTESLNGGDRPSRESREGPRDRGERGRRDRPRGGREERRRELPGDWQREPADGDFVGKELADAIAASLDALGGQRSRSLTQVADELVRRGRLSGDPVSLVPTLAAAARGDNARRQGRHQRPRFRLEGDELSLFEWSLPNEAIKAERDVDQSATRQRDLVRRAFVRRLSELPTASLMEILATWMNVVGIASLRGIRRPGSSSQELHLAGVLKQGPLETPIAIVVVRDGSSVGRERVVDIRGALHHYGNASAAWIITLGQVLSGAREECAAPGAAPCALFDGQELALAMEQAQIGLRTFSVPVLALDVDLLETLRGPGAKPAPRREPEKPAPTEARESEAPTSDDDTESSATDSEGSPNGKKRRRRRRRRGSGASDDVGATTSAGDGEGGEAASEADATTEGPAELTAIHSTDAGEEIASPEGRADEALAEGLEADALATTESTDEELDDEGYDAREADDDSEDDSDDESYEAGEPDDDSDDESYDASEIDDDDDDDYDASIDRKREEE